MELLQVPTASPVYVAVALVPHAAITSFLLAGSLLLAYFAAPLIRRLLPRRRRHPFNE
jgi:hypothetical protein